MRARHVELINKTSVLAPLRFLQNGKPAAHKASEPSWPSIGTTFAPWGNSTQQILVGSTALPTAVLLDGDR